MIVDHLNTYLLGGAALAASRLHRALLAGGIESHFWHNGKSTPKEKDGSYHVVRWAMDRGGNPLRRAVGRMAAAIRTLQLKVELKSSLLGRPSGLEMFNVSRCPIPTPYDPQRFTGDILHLHWIARLVDYQSFFAAVPDELPIVWTLHDMHAFTGGCHYTAGCEAFATECSHCPQLGRRGATDLSNRTFHVKQRALQGKNLHVVAPSNWLMEQACRSPLLAGARSFHTIPHGVDVEIFSPQHKAAARRSWGLPQDRVVIGFGADLIDIRRKGLGLLLDALERLPTKTPVVALVFGKGELPSSGRRLPHVKSIGFLDEPHSQAAAYSATDIFVVPSLQEAFGLTGLEAMACGTPVVAFATGGMLDDVRPAETGLLAQVGNSADLAQKIAWLVDRPHERQQMGAQARAMVLREFNAVKQVECYIHLYRSLLNASRLGKRPAA
jgi:glycosyltransferase involved in cell wall biosynthesis